MTISISPRFGFTMWNADDDQIQREQFLSNFAAIEALGAQCTKDVLANRPGPGAGQRFYFATDTGALFYDTGSAWQTVLFTPDSEYVAAQRPAPGSDGRYVFETDALRLFRDAGSRYVEILTSTIFPAGIILPTAAAVQPPGWLFCDGSSYSPNQYPDLYAVIGTKYGANGSNFNVPDLRGRFIAGAWSLGAGGYGALGAHDHGQHLHPTTTEFHEHVYLTPVTPQGDAFTQGPVASGGNGLAGYNTGDSTVPQSANLLNFFFGSYLIKATGGPRD